MRTRDINNAHGANSDGRPRGWTSMNGGFGERIWRAGVGRSATVGFGGRDQPGEITPQFAPRSPARRRPRCQSIGRGSQRTHMTPAAMTASRGGGQMQVLVSRVHSDNRVQKGQTHLDGHPAVSTEVRPAARFGDRRRDGRCACKGARALCSLDRNRGGHHLQTDTLREWQACRHVPVPCVRLFPTSSTRSETKAAGVGNYAISVSGDTGTSLAELSRSDKRRALAANRLIAQSSQNARGCVKTWKLPKRENFLH